MSIKTVLFDMDGTLLPMNQDAFVEGYFKSISAKIAPYGYEPRKLIETIIRGTYAMVDGDGKKPNEHIFWQIFTGEYGEKAIEDKPLFDKYYEDNFDELKIYTSCNPEAGELVSQLKNAGIDLVLATNPLFPAVAIQKRLAWAGIDYRCFKHYTTYENSSYCKPNPMYYKEILSVLGLKACECVMVGNDVDDDMIAADVGINVFLMTDCLINRHNKDISKYPHGCFKQLKNFLKENI